MSFAVRVRKFSSQVWSLFVHFAHGGVVVTGVMALVVVGGFLTGRLGPVDVIASHDDPVAETVAMAQDTEAADAQLDARMRAVAEYLSKRYRVSSIAIEPLVLAAQEAGQRFSLDPLLLLAVMAIESRFNPFAESVMGAKGLMQVIPRFHVEKVADASDVSEAQVALLDPMTNIQVGAWVLRESISRAGSVERGLQFYNGAPDDPSTRYANKVLAEKQRIEQALRNARLPVREA